MIKNILLGILFLWNIATFSQNVSGIIKNKQTQEPIPYVTIQINTNYGTISNEEGNFSLNIEKFTEDTLVKFSCIGFKTKEIKIKDVSETVFLEEQIVNLDEVDIDNQKQLTEKEIILKVTENLSQNYDDLVNTKQKIFTRLRTENNIKKLKLVIDKSKNYDKTLIQRFNKLLDSIKKPMIANNDISYRDVLYNLYHKSKDSIKIALQKATHLSNPDLNFSMDKLQEKFKNVFMKLYTDKVFKVKIAFFKVQDSLKISDMEGDKKDNKPKIYPVEILYKTKGIFKNTVYRKNDLFAEVLNTKKYEYTTVNTLYFNNELVYEIDYKPRKTSALYSGKMYVSDETFAILKLDFTMRKGKKLEGVNLKWVGFKYKIYNWKGSIEFYKRDNNKYTPKYIRQSKDMYSYVKMPFKFIENTKAKNKLKFKLKTQIENIVNEKQEFLFLENNTLSNTEYKAVSVQKDFPIQILKKYNPNIWKQYNIIAPTQSILDYQVSQ